MLASQTYNSVVRVARICLLVLVALVGRSATARSQHWSLDARLVGLGAVGGTATVAGATLDPGDSDTVVVLPFGLLQILRDRNVYHPSSPGFDPVRAVEYASNPFHYVVGRSSESSIEARLASDVRNATLSRDLGRYVGFEPTTGRLADASLFSVGHTFWIRSADGHANHGIFVGAGPYVSVETMGAIDERLHEVFATGVDVADSTLGLSNAAHGQVALAVTGGYRGRLVRRHNASGRASRDGLYFGANYHFLRGLLYERDDLRMQLNTDQAGLVLDSSNIVVRHRHASGGVGLAVDLGATAVVNRWAVGFVAAGLLNRINWNDVTETTYLLAGLTSGNREFTPVVGVGHTDERVATPADYRGTAEYDVDGWHVKMAAGHGVGGFLAYGGIERRFKMIELRGGSQYHLGAWNPAGGVGIALNQGVSLDVAGFGTNANVEQRRQFGIAVSLRFKHVER